MGEFKVYSPCVKILCTADVAMGMRESRHHFLTHVILHVQYSGDPYETSQVDSGLKPQMPLASKGTVASLTTEYGGIRGGGGTWRVLPDGVHCNATPICAPSLPSALWKVPR